MHPLIFLSPHLDDVVLSAGGLVWEQVQTGAHAEIWTICAGDPPPPPYTAFVDELHARWGADAAQASAVRRAEDANACAALGAAYRHSPVPDCIYRRFPAGEPVIPERDALFRPLPHPENDLARQVAGWIAAALPDGAQLVSPLALGGHVDHVLVRAAAEMVGRPLLYYADYPYAVSDPLNGTDLRGQVRGCRPGLEQAVSPAGLAAWQNGVAAYTSQISTFWGSLDDMRARIAQYHAESGQVTLLWQIC